MGANFFDRFDTAPVATPPVANGNPFDQFDVQTRQNVGAEPQRRNYALSEVPAAAVTNIPKSTAEAAMGIYQAVTSPIETAKTIGDVLAGGVYNILPKEAVSFIDKFDSNPANKERAIKTANAVGGIYTDRYGDWEKIKRTMAEDPIGAISDLSLLFSGGAGAASKVGMAKTAGALTTAASATA
jgi:hypothetical protein